MTTSFVTSRATRVFLIALLALSVVGVFIHTGQSRTYDEDPRLDAMHEAVDRIWEKTDSPVRRGLIGRPWVWGPEPISTSVETYPGGPDGLRYFTYYDKGRLDVRDLGRDPNDPWYAVGGLLVSEMLAGQVQLGEGLFVPNAQPQIPLTGDLDQPDPVTYATIAPYSAVYQHQSERDTGRSIVPEPLDGENRAGQPVTDLLTPDGAIVPGAVPQDSVLLGEYDAATDINVAAPFEEWVNVQPYPDLYLLGHAISPAFWIDTIVRGEPQRVLIQAFERRVMQYTPDKPAGWRVESANVGQHYRLWRGLHAVTDRELIPLALGVPFGEEIVGAALEADVDPFMLAAISRAASGGDPLARQPNAGRGLLAVQPNVDGQPARLSLELPIINARYAANDLRFWLPEQQESFDWRAVLANYYTQGQPNWNNPALEQFVREVLDEYGQLKEAYPPLPAEALNAEYWGGVLATGPAAYYDPSYDVAWWERTLLLYDSKGVIKPGWEPDPYGYYCVRPGYVPGHKLRLSANGVTITCTVGDMVADHDLDGWLNISGWAVEMSWRTFTALGLDRSNWVQVEYAGPYPHRPPPIPPSDEAPAQAATSP